jgi:GT2 family glycosyltransferase
VETVTAVLTSHNRRTKTVASLTALANQRQVVNEEVRLRAILIDASSHDGTVEAVGDFADWLTVVSVPASVYWSTGMRLGNELVGRTDYRLWLNDDTTLDEDGLGVLLAGARRVRGGPVIGLYELRRAG